MVENPVPIPTTTLSKTQKGVLDGLGCFISIVFWFSFSCVLFYSVAWGCFAWTCAPPRTFSLLEWDIPASYFPENARIGKLSAPTDPDGAVESGHQSIYWNHGNSFAFYRVERLATINEARRFYNFHSPGLENSVAFSPDFISGQSNESKIRCGNPVFGGNACFFTARYEEFVIYFRATIDRDMTMDEFKAIVQYLDQRVICDLYQICEGNE